jgi:hypothetical protein
MCAGCGARRIPGPPSASIRGDEFLRLAPASIHELRRSGVFPPLLFALVTTSHESGLALPRSQPVRLPRHRQGRRQATRPAMLESSAGKQHAKASMYRQQTAEPRILCCVPTSCRDCSCERSSAMFPYELLLIRTTGCRLGCVSILRLGQYICVLDNTWAGQREIKRLLVRFRIDRDEKPSPRIKPGLDGPANLSSLDFRGFFELDQPAVTGRIGCSRVAVE